MDILRKDIRYNAIFDESVVIRPEEYRWLTSPMPGMERMMLDRIGSEVARATSIVRYQPNSAFSSHNHDGGEKYLVLKGTYVRNSVGTSHTPVIGTDDATIFVKLHQFADDDNEQRQINTQSAQWLPGMVEGLSIMPLHKFTGEQVALVKWAPHTQFTRHQHWKGEEILVLEGTIYDEQGSYPQAS